MTDVECAHEVVEQWWSLYWCTVCGVQVPRPAEWSGNTSGSER